MTILSLLFYQKIAKKSTNFLTQKLTKKALNDKVFLKKNIVQEDKMKQDIRILILPSFEWCEKRDLLLPIPGNLIRSLLLGLEARDMRPKLLPPSDIDSAKKYLNENEIDLIMVSDNLAKSIDDLEDEKNLGLKFYEEIKNNPKYKETPVVIQSFSQYNEALVKLREIDFYYGPDMGLMKLNEFIKKIRDQIIRKNQD